MVINELKFCQNAVSNWVECKINYLLDKGIGCVEQGHTEDIIPMGCCGHIIPYWFWGGCDAR